MVELDFILNNVSNTGFCATERNSFYLSIIIKANLLKGLVILKVVKDLLARKPSRPSWIWCGSTKLLFTTIIIKTDTS